jgi:cyclic pyranopterin phosphate synthase
VNATSDSFDRPLRDLRISVTDRCNFRCPYCMPAEIFGEHYEFMKRPALLTFEEIERLATLFVELGVEKIRITGGEPLLRTQLPRLIERLALLDGLRDLTLTTNGYLLEKHAQALRDAGLQRITVSLDSHDEEIFQQMNGRKFEMAPVLAGIRAAEAAGLLPIKLNCVVQRGVNEDSILGLARMWKGSGHIVRFIEFMDVGTLNQWEFGRVVTSREVVERIDAEFPVEPVGPSYPGEVASRWRYKDGSGEIGVISSVSQPFCGSCTRARLTLDGSLVTCLFATGGVDLRGPMRDGASDADLREKIAGVWKVRADRYSEERSANTDLDGHVKPSAKIEMYHIGG